MRDDRFRQIESLFQDALLRPSAEREAYLREACTGDSDLYREVASLLVEHPDMTGGEAWAATAAARLIAAPVALEAGHRLGPYEITAFLASGGMGAVYKAHDTRLNRSVAIKKLTAAHSDRFNQEARAIAALNHPHICQLYDVGADYLVMEYVDGRPLHGPVPVEEAIRLAIQIAGALEAAHKGGILHRDLKPANVMVTEDGSAKLLDFGLAKLLTTDPDVTRTVEGTVLGTAAYMSPEQAEGKPLDERSDVFSFGATLYEMLSGNRAFAGQSTVQVLNAIIRQDPPALQAPPALERIVRRCIAKQPGERFQTIAEVKKALEQVARDLAAAPRAEPQTSIAVLPFADMSAGRDHEWFSDGLAEEIINALTHVPGLKVIARTSAFAFKGKQEDIRRIAETLGVTSILEGSVRKAGDRIRVTAQLITGADGSHLWSERYDREFADIFAIQDDIARAIATALQVTLRPTAASLPRHTPNLPAYEAFLQGRHHFLKVTPESLARGRECLERAIALDQQFADPHALLSGYFRLLAHLGVRPAHETMPLARAAAQRALDIDPLLPQAQAALASVAADYDFDWKEAERRFARAMACEPVPPGVRWLYSRYLACVGRVHDAIDEVERALGEDPLNVLCRAYLSGFLVAAGRHDDALRQLRQILDLDEHAWFGLSLMGLAHASKGLFAEALVFLEKAFALAPWDDVVIGVLAGSLMRTGDGSRADALLHSLAGRPDHAAPLGFMLFHLVSGDMERAADWAEKAIEQRHPAIIGFMQGLRNSPRWPGLMRMMNLPPVTAS